MTGRPGEAMRDATTRAYDDADDLPTIRAFVREESRRRGLAAEPVEALAIAVSELVTNTLQHTTAGGRVRVWADDASVYCDVIDGGPIRAFGRAMPAPQAERGRGLAIVERLCDEVTAMAEPDCTVVRLRFAM